MVIDRISRILCQRFPELKEYCKYSLQAPSCYPISVVHDWGVKLSLCGDNPAEIDKLNYSIYVNTLSEIVLKTKIEETPLTIGIHGAWGSGKTSLMKMLQKDLGTGIKSLWFNAWEYDKTDNIWAALFQSILNEMDQKNKKNKILAKTFLTVLTDLSIKGLTRGSMSFTDIEKYYKNYNKHVAEITNLKTRFEDAIEEDVGVEGKYVIFIDDLDRCLPERAVDILETIKLFLSAKHCIFIIGVDKDVIWKGIEARYSGKLNNSPIKGKDYIEKIIQVPFNIPPIQIDDISNFIREIYKDAFLKNIDADILKIISSGMEPNPRKIKRFVNLFGILIKFKNHNITSKRIEKDVIQDHLLAKFLVIQIRWEEFFNDLIRYYNLTGNNLVKDLNSFEENRNEKDTKNEYLDYNPLIQEFKKYLDLNYFGLRRYLNREPIFGDNLEPYIHLSQTTSVEETESKTSSINTLLKAIESSDENERIEAIDEIALNIDKIINPEKLLKNLIKDQSWVVRCKAVWTIVKNYDKIRNYRELVEIQF